MQKSDGKRFLPKMPLFRKMGQIGSKSVFFKVFQNFLKIGFKDFSDFLPKVRGQYRLTTEIRLFWKNLNFGPGGQKGRKITQKWTPQTRKWSFFINFFYSKSLNSQKKAIKFFLDHFDPFWPTPDTQKFSGQMWFFKVFQSFLKIGSKDFSAFL